VFECVLDTKQLERLQKRLQRCLNVQQDQLRFYPLSEKNRQQTIVLGIQPEYSISDRAFIV
jgi:CRISPR-associated protein Cas2